MKYLYTKNKDYNEFIKENNNSDRLSKNLKIFTTSKNKLLKINEIFDRVLKTKYEIIPNSEYEIIFNTNNSYEYRLNLMPIYELEKGKVYHIAFTDSKNQIGDLDYEKLLNRNNMIEVLNRISFIIEDLINKDIIENNFCIGGTDLELKNKIYEYFLKIIVGENGFQKKPTKEYNTGWGLYFKK